MFIVKPIEYGFCPYIKTEETILKKMRDEIDKVPKDYNLIYLPLAHIINTMGVDAVNRIIEPIELDKRVFVCQHIKVNQIKFREDDIVFTPHSKVGDRFITIPHYSVNIDPVYGNNDKHLFSFLGSITTHPTRRQIVEKYDNCFDSTKHWGLDIGMPKEFNRKYIELLGDSKFSLCPRGTGISSVRLFESMAMGSIPVIIADNYEPPACDKLDWDKFSVTIKESEVANIPSILSSYTEETIKEMRERVLRIYNECFSNSNLHKVIIEKLK